MVSTSYCLGNRTGIVHEALCVRQRAGRATSRGSREKREHLAAGRSYLAWAAERGSPRPLRDADNPKWEPNKV